MGLSAMLFSGLEQALRALASAPPHIARELVAPWAACDIRELRFLACRTYLTVGDCGALWHSCSPTSTTSGSATETAPGGPAVSSSKWPLPAAPTPS